MPYQREIWNVRQKASANDTDPPQPNDTSKPLRPFLVLGSYRAYHEQKVTLLPIQTNEPRVVFKVELAPTKENGLSNHSWVICSEIITVPGNYLLNRLGILTNQDFELVSASVGTYLALLNPKTKD